MSSAFGATFGARRKYLSMSSGFAYPARSTPHFHFETEHV